MNHLDAFLAQMDEHGAAVAYIGKDNHKITNWHGDILGNARQTAAWRVSSCYGTHMRQYSASAGGRQLTGRSFGEGMAIVLRETVESKRIRAKLSAA